MPIFQDDLRRHPSASPNRSPFVVPDPSPTLSFARRVSEESIRTEFCEGLLPDSPSDAILTSSGSPNADPDLETSQATSDRLELIERLKRGESPTWIPNRHVC